MRLCDVFEDIVDKEPDVVIVEGIVNMFAVSSSANEAFLVQDL